MFGHYSGTSRESSLDIDSRELFRLATNYERRGDHLDRRGLLSVGNYRIRLPEVAPNVCFGGPKRNRLFMAASQSLYAFYVNTQGATPG
jgi:sugar lactone lactonase YvrE